MNILLGTHFLAKTGGTENYTYALAHELRRRGHHVEYYAIERGKTASRMEEEGFPYMAMDNYDLVLANHTTVVRELWTRGFIIQTCHGTLPELEQPSPLADAYVGVSQEVCQHLQRLGYSSTVIHNGIDCHRFRPKQPVSPSLHTVLSLCHSDIANDFIRQCCQRAGLEFIQCNKFKENVWEVEDLINRSDLVVGLGRSAYDALACGRCVLVYDFREHYMNEFLGEGMLCPENIEKSMSCNCTGKASRLKYDEAGFIREMQRYSPDLAAWGRDYAVRNLNIELAAEKYLQLYDEADVKQNYGAYKRRLRSSLAGETALLGEVMNERQRLEQTLAAVQEKAADRSRRHLRAIRLLLWLSVAMAVLCAASFLWLSRGSW